MISSTLTDSVITDTGKKKKKKKGKKSGRCQSRSLSSVNSLYKSHKSKASQNYVAKNKEKKQARWNRLLYH